MGYEKLVGNPLFSMGVGSSVPIGYNWEHPDYVRMSDIWKTCRDAVEGQVAIKEGATTYLPKLNGQSDVEYSNYLNRALYYNATGRTVQSYNGMIFRKDPVVKVQGSDGEDSTFNKKSYFKSITNKGKSLTDLLHDVVDEVIQVNRVGVLVDYPDETEFGSVSGMTKFDKEKLGWKPLLTKYKTESIVNWQYMYVGTTPIPVMYVLKESVYDWAGGLSIFPEKSDIYRILALEPYVEIEGAPLKMRYKQITFKETLQKEEGKKGKPVWAISEIIYPKKNGEYLNYIPFYIITDQGIDFERLENPMIYDLAELNISHFRNSADWENELHMVAAKTIYFPGWDKDIYGDPRFGGALAGPENCKPSVIEASNKSGLADEMQAKEERMSVLGSEAISKQGRYVASAATAKISSKAEASILTTMTVSLSSAFSEILTFALEWDEQPDLTVEVILNYDFYDENISAQELVQYMKVWQSGGLSRTAYFNLLQKKETYPDGWDEDKEFNAIREEMGYLADLPEERYVELLERINKIAELTKQMESGAIANLVAEGIPENVGAVNMELQIETNPSQEAVTVEEEIEGTEE